MRCRPASSAVAVTTLVTLLLTAVGLGARAATHHSIYSAAPQRLEDAEREVARPDSAIVRARTAHRETRTHAAPEIGVDLEEFRKTSPRSRAASRSRMHASRSGDDLPPPARPAIADVERFRLRVTPPIP